MKFRDTEPASYEQAILEIEDRGQMPTRVPSLAPMRGALRASGLETRVDPRRTLVVAGTNGKGSTCAYLEALLRSAGRRCALYTSPHLEKTTERLRIDGLDLTEAEFLRLYLRVRPFCRLFDLSHFECLTLLAVEACFGETSRPVDWAIFEVGLGGVWDATNAIPHDWAVITPLGLDHQNLLGTTLPEIARNKFGIVGSHARVVHAPLDSSLEELKRDWIERTRSDWRQAASGSMRVTIHEGTPRFSVTTPWGEAELGLPGRRGADNALLALTIFEEWGFDPSAHLPALSQVRWPGRMERVAWPEAPCPVYLSGDHNAAGFESLMELLKHYPRRHLHLLMGLGTDKDVEGVARVLKGLDQVSLHLTETPFKGRKLEDHGSLSERARIREAVPREALRKLLQQEAREGDLVVVTGSLYLVGALRAEFNSRA